MAQVTIPYKPRTLQAELHDAVGRFAVLVCHRRFGKTVWAINHLIKEAVDRRMKGYERPRVHYLAPLFRQAKQVAWDYVKYYTAPIPGVTYNETELRADFLDCRLSLLGADNPDSLRGIYSDYAVLDEYEQMSPVVWSEIIRPALSDREGGGVFIGTPKGRNQFYEQWLNARKLGWFRAMYKASETGILSQAELDAARAEMGEDEYMQEYECSWSAAIKGAYYGDLMGQADAEKRIGNIPHTPMLDVNTAWDLGINDSTAVWFYQYINNEIRLIDFYENTGQGLEHYVRMLQHKEKKFKYSYDQHHFPHDVAVRELTTGRSRQEVLAAMGINVFVTPKLKVEDGIQAVRTVLPRCYFDKTRCHKGIEALRQYRTEYDSKLQRYSSRPLHDWTSHPADAFRTFALSAPEGGGATSRTMNKVIDFRKRARQLRSRWAHG
jgi:hypothetical protein